MIFLELINADTSKRELFNIASIPHVRDMGHGFIEINKSIYNISYEKFKNLINKHHAKNTLEKIN